MPEAPADAFPLDWPEGWPRTAPNRRQRARFQTTHDVAQRDLVHELELLGARHAVISTNIPVRRDGLPYARYRAPDDPGVAVYWQQRVGRGADRQWAWRVIACDRWDRIRDNLRAIGLSIAALRGLDRWGASELLDRAFAGFAALPAAGPSHRPWWEVLQVPRDANANEVRAAYRSLARERHPDVGGTDDEMAELNRAWQEWREEGVPS